MDELLSAFGIDWRLLTINIINFGVLLIALWYFLYGPLMRILEERRQKTAQGVIDAEEAKQRLEQVEESRSEMLAAAGHEADTLVASARKSGSEKERELIAQGEESAKRIVDSAEAEAKEAKAKALAESKQEIAKLIVLGIEKTIRKS